MIAKCEGSYHGAFDTAEVSQNPSPQAWGEASRPPSVATSRGTPQAVLDNVLVLPFNDAEASLERLRAHASQLAAILVDPMPNRVGLIPATPAYLAALRSAADEIGALLIMDEVITFRLGYRGAQGRFAVRPDLTALGKIIGGGFPVGCVAGRAEVLQIFDPAQSAPPILQGGTFTANPITMTAGQVSMRLLDPPAFEKLERQGDRLRQDMADAFAESGMAGQVSGLGSLLRVHLHGRPLSDYRSSYTDAAGKARMAAFHRLMLEEGVLIAPSGLMSLSTPMTDVDIAAIGAAFRRTLARLGAEAAA
jgi:glutamate-1-semialdehyde 2,1-aminomutase